MFHLVKDTISSIENNLLWSKSIRDSVSYFWFNLFLFVFIVGVFVVFMYMSYGTGTPPELQKIKFEPNVWHNAVKNVPIIDYGQIPQTETGSGVQEFSYRTSASNF